MKITPDNITELAPNEIFVFGSNLSGRHGKGAAKTAMQKFGAKAGQGSGLMGQSYGIPTKGVGLDILDLPHIAYYVQDFLEVAKAYPKKEFLVTAIGTGLSHYTAKQIAPLFLEHPIPNNVSLPKSFWDQKETGSV